MSTYTESYYRNIFQNAILDTEPSEYILDKQNAAEHDGVSKRDFIREMHKAFEFLRSKYQQSVDEVAKQNQLNRDTGIDEFHYSLGDGKGLSFEEFQAHEDTARQKDLDDAVEGMKAFNVLAGIIFDALKTDDELNIIPLPGVAEKLNKWIKGATDSDLAFIIQKRRLPSGSKKPKWIGSKADAWRFKSIIGMYMPKDFNDCFCGITLHDHDEPKNLDIGIEPVMNEILDYIEEKQNKNKTGKTKTVNVLTEKA